GVAIGPAMINTRLSTSTKANRILDVLFTFSPFVFIFAVHPRNIWDVGAHPRPTSSPVQERLHGQE
ncbi:MAG: hypothetical protein ACFFH0_10415, partial [Promethearchaeota archaeon]